MRISRRMTENGGKLLENKMNKMGFRRTEKKVTTKGEQNENGQREKKGRERLRERKKVIEKGTRTNAAKIGL